jgi:hypothetical protein
LYAAACRDFQWFNQSKLFVSLCGVPESSQVFRAGRSAIKIHSVKAVKRQYISERARCMQIFKGAASRVRWKLCMACMAVGIRGQIDMYMMSKMTGE